MSSNVIDIKKKPIERIKQDLNDPEFIEDMEHAKNILIIVQKGEANGMVNHIIYAADDIPNLVYLLESSKHLFLSATKEQDSA